jgi:integrase
MSPHFSAFLNAVREFDPGFYAFFLMAIRTGLRKGELLAVFHDMRHTFGSLLIQDGASLAYVRDQMGHSSIQITADIYGHLIPGADI